MTNVVTYALIVGITCSCSLSATKKIVSPPPSPSAGTKHALKPKMSFFIKPPAQRKSKNIFKLIKENKLQEIKDLLYKDPKAVTQKSDHHPRKMPLDLAKQLRDVRLYKLLLSYNAPVREYQFEANMSFEKVLAITYSNAIFDWESSHDNEYKIKRFNELHPKIQKIIINRACVSQDLERLTLLHATKNPLCSWYNFAKTTITCTKSKFKHLKYVLEKIQEESDHTKKLNVIAKKFGIK